MEFPWCRACVASHILRQWLPMPQGDGIVGLSQEHGMVQASLGCCTQNSVSLSVVREYTRQRMRYTMIDSHLRLPRRGCPGYCRWVFTSVIDRLACQATKERKASTAWLSYTLDLCPPLLCWTWGLSLPFLLRWSCALRITLLLSWTWFLMTLSIALLLTLAPQC